METWGKENVLGFQFREGNMSVKNVRGNMSRGGNVRLPMSDRQTSRTSVTIVCISCIRCSLILLIIIIVISTFISRHMVITPRGGGGVSEGKYHIVDIASLSEGTSLQKHSGMARVVKGFHSLPAHSRVYPRMDWTTPTFAFLIYRPRRDGRLSWRRHHHGEYSTIYRRPLLDSYHRGQLLKPSRLTGQLEHSRTHDLSGRKLLSHRATVSDVLFNKQAIKVICQRLHRTAHHCEC